MQVIHKDCRINRFDEYIIEYSQMMEDYYSSLFISAVTIFHYYLEPSYESELYDTIRIEGDHDDLTIRNIKGEYCDIVLGRMMETIEMCLNSINYSIYKENGKQWHIK